jgi:hypothetical protein
LSLSFSAAANKNGSHESEQVKQFLLHQISSLPLLTAIAVAHAISRRNEEMQCACQTGQALSSAFSVRSFAVLACVASHDGRGVIGLTLWSVCGRLSSGVVARLALPLSTCV